MKFTAVIDTEGGFVIAPEILEELGWNEGTPLMIELGGKVGTISRITEEEFCSSEVEA